MRTRNISPLFTTTEKPVHLADDTAGQSGPDIHRNITRHDYDTKKLPPQIFRGLNPHYVDITNFELC